MFPDIILGFLAKSHALSRLRVKLLHHAGKRFRLIRNLHDPFRFRDSFRTNGRGHNGRAIIDSLHHFAFYSRAIAKRHHHNPAGSIKRCQLLLGDKAFDNDSSVRIVEGLNLFCHLGAHNIKVHRQFLTNQRENLPGKPEHRVRVGRMSKAADKQQPFPFCKIHIDLLQETLIHIGRNGLQLQFRPLGMDGIHLHLGRIIGYSCLLHQCQLDGFPVIGLPLFLNVSGQLIFPVFPQKMEIMAVINDFDVCVLLQKVHIFRCNMGPVQVCKINFILIFHNPVPYSRLVFGSIKNLDSHLLKGGGIWFFMKEIISQEFYRVPHL